MLQLPSRKLVVLCLCLSAKPALAIEGAVYGGPIGGTDIRNAYVPSQSGLYIGLADVPGYATQFNGNNGGKSSTVTRLNFAYNADAAALAYVYPYKPFGLTLSTAAQVGNINYERFSTNNNTQRITGWLDTYSDILKVTKFLGKAAPPSPGARPLPYGLTVQAAYSMIFPTGAYNTHQFNTAGHNDYFYIPNAAATYLTRPNFIGDGLELSGRLYYDHASVNPATHYYSGDVVNLDYAVSERSGNLQYGIYGNAASQIQNDTRSGVEVSIKGKHFVFVKAGPVIAYDIPSSAVTVKAKVNLPIYVRNATLGPQFVFSVGFRL